MGGWIAGRRSKFLVLALWLVAAGFAGRLGDLQTDDIVATLPGSAVLTSLPLVQLVQIGFAVAFGILLDTLIVRSVLVTALSLDIGRCMWWPSRLFHKADEAMPAP
ncbi:MMPL family transporter [Micromonospora sp. CA-259024]|uniref:MMPL family transporter n=1 Tax=Micromonospora sp. CA-259024 TaxID=3239965 RepID=UPI003D928889